MEFEFLNERKDKSRPVDGEDSMEQTLIRFFHAIQPDAPDRENNGLQIFESQVYCSKCGYSFSFKEGWVAAPPTNVLAKVKCHNCGADAAIRTK
ncbi:MAG: hypothetical protein JNM18_16720 [Planctomycetaceae bacterium]|nr:hypothetical protein [Planctomycetaceae bacterium]